MIIIIDIMDQWPIDWPYCYWLLLMILCYWLLLLIDISWLMMIVSEWPSWLIVIVIDGIGHECYWILIIDIDPLLIDSISIIGNCIDIVLDWVDCYYYYCYWQY